MIESVLTSAADNKLLVGLAVFVTLITGIPLVLDSFRRVARFFSANHWTNWHVYKIFFERIEASAEISMKNQMFFLSTIWLKISRCFIHAIYFFLVFAVISLIRIGNNNAVGYENSIFVDLILKMGLYSVLILSAVNILLTLVEVNTICRYVNKKSIGEDA